MYRYLFFFNPPWSPQRPPFFSEVKTRKKADEKRREGRHRSFYGHDSVVKTLKECRQDSQNSRHRTEFAFGPDRDKKKVGQHELRKRKNTG